MKIRRLTAIYVLLDEEGKDKGFFSSITKAMEEKKRLEMLKVKE